MDSAEQIRTEATRLFARRGYEGTSLQFIAERVGVTKQTLLYHYPSKEALHRAVLDRLFAHWRERLPQMLEAVTSGQGRFDALTRELIGFFSADADRARLLVRELLDHPDETRRMLGETLRPWVLLVAEYIREGQRLGQIWDDVDPEAYVMNVILTVVASFGARGVADAVLDGGNLRGFERQTAELLRVTRAGLFRPRTPSDDPTRSKIS